MRGAWQAELIAQCSGPASLETSHSQGLDGAHHPTTLRNHHVLVLHFMHIPATGVFVTSHTLTKQSVCRLFSLTLHLLKHLWGHSWSKTSIQHVVRHVLSIQQDELGKISAVSGRGRREHEPWMNVSNNPLFRRML